MSSAFRAKRLSYRSAVEWVGEKRGRLTAAGLPPLEVATPPEFKGHPGLWSPEHLVVCAVNACIMTTFLAIAERHRVEFLSYESEAEGTVGVIDGKFMFSRVEVHPRVTVQREEMAAGVTRAIEGAEKRCLITLSLRSEVVVRPEVMARDQLTPD